jgi:CrcB protein
MTALLVLAGGLLGAPARYLTDVWVQSFHSRRFPWGTFTVNVVGSLVLGLAAGLAASGRAPSWVLALVGTGFCGALTTFSTFSFETWRLVEDGLWRRAAGNALGSVAAGLAAGAVGYWLVTAG